MQPSMQQMAHTDVLHVREATPTHLLQSSSGQGGSDGTFVTALPSSRGAEMQHVQSIESINYVEAMSHGC